ncbi:MAG TPA: hypothetical protein VK889_10735 [Solirubrobacterales bacterium]|nr:hypothetical protein [Solirubrobacterales bacterium]
MATSLCVLAIGPAASAGPSFAALAEEEEREGWAGAFRVKASNGYSIEALILQGPGDKGFLLLFVTHEGGGVFYSTRAKVTPDEVEADLGPLGEIDFDLVLSGRERKERSSCDPQPVEFPAGTYRGTFEFRGEEGYARASATKARLIIRPLMEIVCPGDGGGESGGPMLPGARLRAFSRGNADHLSLQVNANRPGARVFYEARTEEMRDGIEISRFVEGIAPRGTFSWDPLLRRATLAPPAPFSGSASFHRVAAPASRWTGDLAVDFPGRSDVRLAGAAMRAGLARAHLDP